MTSLTVRPANGIRSRQPCRPSSTAARRKRRTGGSTVRSVGRCVASSSASPIPVPTIVRGSRPMEPRSTARRPWLAGSNGVVEAAFLVEDAWFRHGDRPGAVRGCWRAKRDDGRAGGHGLGAGRQRAGAAVPPIDGARHATTFAGAASCEISLPVGPRRLLPADSRSATPGHGLMMNALESTALPNCAAIAPFDQCSRTGAPSRRPLMSIASACPGRRRARTREVASLARVRRRSSRATLASVGRSHDGVVDRIDRDPDRWLDRPPTVSRTMRPGRL